MIELDHEAADRITVCTLKDWQKYLKKENKRLENPVTYKHYSFYLCQFPASLKAGYLYYLMVRNRRRILAETESPRFKTKTEALAFVANNQLKGLIPV